MKPANDAAPMNTQDMFGLSVALLPEPETLKADMNHIRCKSLASIIAGLINGNEPLLRAEADGSTIKVRELGGSAAMTIKVEPTA